MADEQSTRACKHCDAVKPLADYWNPVNSRHARWCSSCLALRRSGKLRCKVGDCGGKVYCKGMCRTHYERTRYPERRDSLLEAQRARYAANPEPFLARNRQWAEANRERKAAADAAWCAANRDRKRANDAAYYTARREKVKAQASAWYAANRERARATNDAWRAANPDKRRAAHANRRARKAGSGGKLTAADWRGLLAEFDHACAYCHARDLPLVQEHVTPLSRGGWHDYSNVVPACGPCNGRKATRTLLEFASLPLSSASPCSPSPQSSPPSTACTSPHTSSSEADP